MDRSNQFVIGVATWKHQLHARMNIPIRYFLRHTLILFDRSRLDEQYQCFYQWSEW